MVAEFKIKDVPRSLVRVPGSGRSQGAAAPAISCDLGRVSSLAATIVVNPCLPAIMTGTKVLVTLPTNQLPKNKLATSPAMIDIQGSPTSPSRRRPMNSGTQADISQESKRLRLGVHLTPMNVASSQPTVVSAGIQSNKGQKKPNLITTRRVVTARRTLPQRVTTADYSSRSIEDLLEEQRILREENRMLQQQLARYTQMRQERERHLF